MVDGKREQHDGKVEMPLMDIDVILSRIRKALGTEKDKDLAVILGIDPQGITNAKKRGEVPPIWLVKLASKINISVDWLLFGTGPMRRKVSESGEPELQEPPKVPAQEASQLPASGLAQQSQLPFRISDAVAMTCRVLESGTSYATALYMNIEHFDRAVSAEQRLATLEQELESLRAELDEIKEVVKKLTRAGPGERAAEEGRPESKRERVA